MSNERVIPTPAPSDKPSFTILIDGTELSREYHVASIVVTKIVNRVSRAKLFLLDGDPSSQDFRVSNSNLFIPGKEIEILAGYHSRESSIFKGIIIKHGIKTRKNKPSFLIVECKHKAVKLSVGRKNAYYYDSTDSDVFETIINNYSFDKEIDSTSVEHKELVQYYSTDWDFIVSRSEANGMMVFTNNEKIAIKKPDFSPDPVISLLFGATILEFDAEIDAKSQYAGVKGQGWDIANQEVLESEGEDPQVTEQGNLEASTLAEVINLESLTLQHTGLLSQQELKSWADAQLLKSRMSKIRGRVKFIGSPDVNPGNLIELNGVGERFNGKAFVSGIRHEIGKGTWTTDVQFGLSPNWFIEENEVNPKPGTGLLPSVNGLQIGIVTQLEGDPDGEDRILVKMPLMGDETGDGIWIRVVTLDAGQNRGSFFRPEIGDEIVLGFLNDDPRDPVMLGMLNSSSKPAPIQAKDDNHQKGFVTRSVMKLIFDDEKKSVSIETPAGKSIVLSEDEGSIIMKDENNNKIEMTSEGISIESGSEIKLKATGDLTIEGANLSNKANAQFSAEGSGGAKISSSSMTEIKGSMVKIN